MRSHAGPRTTRARSTAVLERDDAIVSRLRSLGERLDGEPDPHFREATRARLVAMAAVRFPAPPRQPVRQRLRAATAPSLRWRRRATAALTATALTVTGLATLVALSAGAGPGGALYGVKRGTEDTRLALTSDTGRGPALLGLAGARLVELRSLGADPAPQLLLDTLATMDAQTTRGTAGVTTAAVGGTASFPLADLVGWADRQSAGLADVGSALPASVAPAVQDSLGLLAEVAARGAALRAALTCSPGRPVIGTDALGPVPAACPAGQAPQGAGSSDHGAASPAAPGSGVTEPAPSSTSAPTAGGTGPPSASGGAGPAAGTPGQPGGSWPPGAPVPAVPSLPGAPPVPGVPPIPGVPGAPALPGAPAAPPVASPPGIPSAGASGLPLPPLPGAGGTPGGQVGAPVCGVTPAPAGVC